MIVICGPIWTFDLLTTVEAETGAKRARSPTGGRHQPLVQFQPQRQGGQTLPIKRLYHSMNATGSGFNQPHSDPGSA